ncbi:MAG TPA: hypothetical protein VEV42_17580 [Pyrinomonadaceae bacterium]|jgi:hypothetical protein|nr:hypothetical protein [Pyrinomonadaceae bacterium]
MIERVVENWLTNAGERGGYEIAFAQLLSFQGHRVLHKSSHGPMEQGKDIITIAPDGVPCAYQLKAEHDISLTKWRKLKDEIDELIEIPIQHPAVSNDLLNHRAYFVNNGYLKDTVRRLIQDRNRVAKQRGLPELNVIQLGDLVKDFVEVHGRFLPTEPRDFKRFLELYARNGYELLPAGEFSVFLLSILHFYEKQPKKSEVTRAIASTLIFASYVLSPYQESQNSLAVIAGWIMTAAHVLALASKVRLPRKMWKTSFDLCMNGADEAFKHLLVGLKGQADFRQGDPLTDGLIYRARATLLLGYMTAYEHYHHLRNEQSEFHEEISALVEQQKKYLLFSSEAATPAFLSVAWYLERHNKQLEAEGIVLSITEAIAKLNGPDNKGVRLADPYHPLDEVLRMYFPLGQDGLNDIDQEDFEGHSYSLQSLTEWLARRLRRQSLARLWEDITHVCYSEFVPDPRWSTYLWYSPKGELHHRFPARPESWSELVKRSKAARSAHVPSMLRERPDFLLLFLLVYPHRLNPNLVGFLDEVLAGT